MASASAIASAAAALPIPGAQLVGAAGGVASVVQSAITLVDPGKARDAARVHRRDFFLDAAKAGSVYGARYLLGGLANVVAAKEKQEYTDGINELQNGPAVYTETLAQARNLGALWPVGMSAEDGIIFAGNQIATELGQDLNVPADVASVNTQSAITGWASKYGYAIRKDVAQAVAKTAAGVGTAAAGAVSPPGASKPVVIPTNTATIAVVIVAIIGLIYFALRKR